MSLQGKVSTTIGRVTQEAQRGASAPAPGLEVEDVGSSFTDRANPIERTAAETYAMSLIVMLLCGVYFFGP